MGTPSFAVPSLRLLLDHDWPVVAVVTAPDKPAGRGQKIAESEVKKAAIQHNIPVLQPENLKDPNFIKALRALNPDLFVVVAFRILPEAVFEIPPYGTFNLHASLLPHYRGAAPINWAIINGEIETGVSTFFIQKGVDTGKVIFQESTAIGEDETAGELHDRLMNLGARLVLVTVKSIWEGGISPLEQLLDGTEKPAPKIFTADCRIDPEMALQQAYDFIRGLSPYPTAWTLLDNKKLKIFKTQKEVCGHTNEPGELLSDNKTYMKMAFKDGYLLLLDVQLEGKKRMPIEDFLRGYNT